MLALKFLIAIFSLFISPQIILARKYSNILPYSLIILYSLIVSFSSIWILTLLSYYLNLPNIVFFILSVVVFVISIYYLFNIEYKLQKYYLLIILFILILLLPIFRYVNEIYTEWDAIVSWHRWGLELYSNRYNPIDAAYPILVPSLYSIIYKIVGSSDIWIFSKIAIYLFPFFALLIPIVEFIESKNRIYLIVAILLYPYLIMKTTTYGKADIPVMLMGMYSIYALLNAQTIKQTNKELFFKYLYASILLAGLASITKQAGLIFILFTLAYIFINFKSIKGNRLVFIIYLISLLYFLSYLVLYYQNATFGVTGNINDLERLSKNQDILYLIEKFFYYPNTVPIEYIYGYLFIFSIVVFIVEVVIKKINRYKIFALQNLIFLIIGFILWAKIASYHPRNSLFVDDFLITFIAISIYYFTLYLEQISFIKKNIFLVALLILSVILIFIDNKKIYNIQISYQKRVGNALEAKYVAKILENSKNSCIKVYINDYSTRYNYYLKDYKDRLINQAIDKKEYIKDFVEHNCSKGSYILFRPSSASYENWHWIEKLIKQKRLVHIKDYLYFIKPNIKLEDDFFEYKTNLADIKIINPIKNKVYYSLDYIKEYDNNYVIGGWAFKKISKGTTYIVLKNRQNQYIINTIKQYRADVAKKYNLNNKYVGFKAYIYSTNIQKGDYNISILYVDNKKQQFLVKIDKKLKIK